MSIRGAERSEGIAEGEARVPSDDNRVLSATSAVSATTAIQYQIVVELGLHLYNGRKKWYNVRHHG